MHRLALYRLLELKKVFRPHTDEAVEGMYPAGESDPGIRTEGLVDRAEQAFGHPVSDDLHAVDVILGERRDIACAPVLLRSRGARKGRDGNEAGGHGEQRVKQRCQRKPRVEPYGGV